MSHLEHALSSYSINYGRVNKDAIIQIIAGNALDHASAEALYNFCRKEIMLLAEDLRLFQYGKKDKQEAVNAFRLRLGRPIDEKVVEACVQLADWIVAKS